MAPKPPAEAAPAKAALSIVGAITAALFAVAYAVSQQRHDNTPRFDPRYCEGGLRPRPTWALAQPRRFAPESPRDGAPPGCDSIPPVRGAYPTTRKLEDIVASWPINDTNIRAPVGGLCRFDWSKAEDRLKALAYRRAEVPFQVFNVPSLTDAVQRWSSDDYVGTMWHGAATAEVSTYPRGEFAHGPNHFMFHHAGRGSSAASPTTSRSTTLARWLARDAAATPLRGQTAVRGAVPAGRQTRRGRRNASRGRRRRRGPALRRAPRGNDGRGAGARRRDVRRL